MKFLGKIFSTRISDACGCKNNHVGNYLNRLCTEKRVGSLYNKLAISFVDSGNPSPDIIYMILFNGTPDKFIVVLASRPDIHVKYVGFPFVHLMLVEHCMLCRIHTAYL